MELDKKEKEAINKAIKSSRSMKEAREKLKYSRCEFKNRAKSIGLWSPVNKGLEPVNKATKEDLINGEIKSHSHYLKKRLISTRLLKDECVRCGWSKKREDSIYSSCHLHHKDGNELNNLLDNLEILCPNCHSLTLSYCKRKVLKNNI